MDNSRICATFEKNLNFSELTSLNAFAYMSY